MSSDNPEPLLSAEETSALLDAMRSGTEGAEQVDNFDLASPERPLRDALSTADACARSMSEAIDKLILRTTGCSSTTEELPAEITPYKVIRGSLPQGAAVMSLSAADGGMGILVIGPKLVSFILDRRMGAPIGTDLGGEARAELSPLDRRLLQPTASALGEIFGQIWCGDSKAFRASAVLAHNADLPMMAQFEPLLQLAMRVVPLGASGDQIVVALSGGQVIMAKALRRPAALPSNAKAGDRARIEMALKHAEVDAVAVLGEVRSTIRQVLALNVGDLIRLDSTPDRPIELRSGDKMVLRGMPVVRHGNLALHVSQMGETL
jgi:flagellar motor switch protein FliM